MDLLNIANTAQDARNIFEPPEMVHGRVLVCDADVLSYKACDLEHSVSENIQELKEMIDIWRKIAGAEFVELHLTLGTKGGREEIARVKKYQGHRAKDPEKAERVRDLREWMAQYDTMRTMPCPQFEQEADDSMAQSMMALGDKGVLMTIDKDLNMVPGKRLSMATFDIYEQEDGYGKCRLVTREDGSKKLQGSGTSWFWHQLLMGDAADNIPGLPLATKDLWIKYAPTKRIAELQTRLKSGRMPSGKVILGPQRRETLVMFNHAYEKANPKKVGDVLAYKLLKTCGTDRSAYFRCLEAYRAHYGERYDFVGHDGVAYAEQTARDMMYEQARLLWIRREPGQDVVEWFRTFVNDVPDTTGPGNWLDRQTDP